MDDQAQGARDQAGRFRPGVSGNPGGRPTKDQVILRRLGQRASSALSILLDALDAGASVVVIDAREVLADWWDRLSGAEGPPPATPAQIFIRDCRRDAEAAVLLWENGFRREEEFQLLSGGAWLPLAEFAGGNHVTRTTYVELATGRVVPQMAWLGEKQAVYEAAYLAAFHASVIVSA